MLAALGRAIVRVFFRDVVISGGARVPSRGPAIFAPNHPNSILDPLFAFFFSPPHHLRFIAKAPLFRVPVLAFFLRRLGAIAVERRMDAAGDVDYTPFFAACVEALCRGDSLLMFPEGRSLPQPALAPFKTGIARLQQMARERGVDAPIVPLGLNYESPYTFRSAVLVAVGEPLHAGPVPADRTAAARALTADLARQLDTLVFQGDSYRDRELMMLLERLYTTAADDGSWAGRVTRLKEFERALTRLRDACPGEIEALRRLLADYERAGGAAALLPPQRCGDRALRIAGLPLASLGVALNAAPYHLCDWLVRRRHLDESARGTFKLAYALVLYPLTYLIETAIMAALAGGLAAALFALLIVPLTLTTLRYRDWRRCFAPRRERDAAAVEELRGRIVELVDALAVRLT